MSRKRVDNHKMKKLELHEFKDFNMDDFIDKYLYKITPHEDIDEATISVFPEAEIKTKMTFKRRGSTSRTLIEYKCRYLQDAIIRMANTNEDRVFSLNATILKKAIGDDYKPLLDVFIDLGYIEKGDGKHYWYYRVGGYSTLYHLKNTNTHRTKPFFNETIQIYKEHTEEMLKKLRDRMYGKLDEAFVKKYLISLSYIKIDDYDGYNAKVNELTITKPQSETYYHYLTTELERKDKPITKIDDAGRIYHVLTNLKRELKQYLSIDFSIDCKNSHPLLLNWFIFQNKNISINTSCLISVLFKDIYENNSIDIYNKHNGIPNISLTIYHNVSHKLRKLLRDNNIENECVASLSDDELTYIYLTTNGMFWRVFQDKYKAMSKDEIKEAIFEGVFYVKAAHADKFNDFAKDFAEEFPSVFKLIDWWKNYDNRVAIQEYLWQHHLYAEQEEASLSIAMMGLESKIFTTILKKMYAKRWNALHIHDCIVVPKDGNKNHPTKEQVELIMADVYRQFGLAATFSSD